MGLAVTNRRYPIQSTKQNKMASMKILHLVVVMATFCCLLDVCLAQRGDGVSPRPGGPGGEEKEEKKGDWGGPYAAVSVSQSDMAAADWCMYCGDCCDGLTDGQDVQKEALKSQVSDLETALYVQKYCLFCGDCCDGKTELEKQALKEAASEDPDAQNVAQRCTFCGNCCPAKEVAVANYCVRSMECEGKTKEDVLGEMEGKDGGKGNGNKKGNGNGNGNGNGKGNKKGNGK